MTPEILYAIPADLYYLYIPTEITIPSSTYDTNYVFCIPPCLAEAAVEYVAYLEAAYWPMTLEDFLSPEVERMFMDMYKENRELPISNYSSLAGAVDFPSRAPTSASSTSTDTTRIAHSHVTSDPAPPQNALHPEDNERDMADLWSQFIQDDRSIRPPTLSQGPFVKDSNMINPWLPGEPHDQSPGAHATRSYARTLGIY